MTDPERICMRCMAQLPEGSMVCRACGADNATLSNETHQLPIHTILAGKYLVGYALGQGGFGITYVGWDLNLELKVAIKEYYPEGCVSRDMTMQSTVIPMRGTGGDYFQYGREKFVQEAKSLAKFTGTPGIVNVRDFFMENGTAYIVMDYVDGRTLKSLAEANGGRLPARTVLQMMRPLMPALRKVHSAGLLHRDISPDNIMVRPDGTAVLLDFGAARQISSSGEHSNTINVKHGFAPEEQYRTHGEQGPWTDIYALSATIYRLVTGVTPTQALDRLVSGETLTPPNALGGGLTEAEQAAIMKGLAVRKDDRYQSVADFMTALYGEKTEPMPVSSATYIPYLPPQQDTRSGRKLSKRALIGIVAGAAALLVLVLILAFGGKKEAEPAVADVAVSDAASSASPTPVVQGIVETPKEQDTEPQALPVEDGACEIGEALIHITYYEGEVNRRMDFLLPIVNTGEQNLYYSEYSGSLVIQDDAGKKIDDGFLANMYPAIIRPGETGYISGFAWFEADGIYSFRIVPTFDLCVTDSDLMQIAVDNARVEDTKYSGFETKCRITNSTALDYEQDDVKVMALFRGKGGEILGFTEDSNDQTLPAGESMEIEELRNGDQYLGMYAADDVEELEIYANSWASTYANRLTFLPIDTLPAFEAKAVSVESLEARKEDAAAEAPSKTPKVIEGPSPTEAPEGSDPKPTLMTISVNGRQIEVYAARMGQVAYDKVAYWSDSARQISNSLSYTICYRGRIQDCYGVKMYYNAEVKSGNPFEVPWKAMVRLISGQWSRGDAESERSYSYKGGEAEVGVLFFKPQSFSEFVVVPVSLTGNAWETSPTVGLLELYFATEEACQIYLDSVL